MTLAMLYNLVSCIFRMTFTEFEDSHKILVFSLDVLSDMIYLLDFLIRFRTGYLDDGILVGNRVCPCGECVTLSISVFNVKFKCKS